MAVGGETQQMIKEIDARNTQEWNRGQCIVIMWWGTLSMGGATNPLLGHPWRPGCFGAEFPVIPGEFQHDTHTMRSTSRSGGGGGTRWMTVLDKADPVDGNDFSMQWNWSPGPRHTPPTRRRTKTRRNLISMTENQLVRNGRVAVAVRRRFPLHSLRDAHHSLGLDKIIIAQLSAKK